MATTAKGYPYPLGSDGPDGADVPYWLNLLAVFLNTNGAMYDAGSTLPAAGKAGRFFRVTSTSPNGIYLDTGSDWVNVSGFTQAVADTLYAPIDDPALTDQRVPVDGSVTAAKVADALKPSAGAIGATEALRALGTSAATAAAGNDARLSGAAHGPAGAQQIPRPRAGVYRAAGAKALTGSYVAVDFDTERYDNDTIHDPATNNTRLTAKTAGLYLVSARGTTTNTGNTNAAKATLNGSTDLGGTDTEKGVWAFTLTVQLAVNDYLELLARSNGSSPTITVTEFGMLWVAESL